MGYPSNAYLDRKMPEKLPKIVSVKPLGGYRLELAFADGAHGAHDFSWVFERIGPMNEPLRDQNYFARVFLENGALAWPNGFDLSPWNVQRRMEEAGQLKAQEIAAE
jgi:Protein of unknown function (DUF2442)